MKHLHHYETKFIWSNCCRAYGNAVQDDLWNALNDQAAIDGIILPATIKTIMDTWTMKQGYPLIKVIREYENGGATVHQVCQSFPHYIVINDKIMFIIAGQYNVIFI